MIASFLNMYLIYDVYMIKTNVFNFIISFKNSTFVKLLYYFNHEYFSFTKALQLQVIFYRAGYFVNWYMDAARCH